MKRGISILLTICMILALIPNKAAAAETAAFSEPNVTTLTVSYDGGETQDLLENQSTISLPAGSKPVFTVTFDNSEPLNRVFVTSTKNGETKYLEAKPQGGQYVTDDYFDPSEVNYIPGTISVTYSKKTVKVGEIGAMDINTLKAQLSSQGISSRNETTEADGTVTAQVVLGDMFGAMADECFDAAVSEFTAGAGIDQSELDRWLGAYQNLSELSSYDLDGVDGKQYTLYLSDKDFGDTDTYLVMVKDATSNKYTKTILKKATNKAGLGDISDTLSAANVVTKKLLEYNAISKETAVLREEIEAHPTMTAQEKAEANTKIDALDRDKRLFLIGMTAVSLMVPPASAPLMISALVAGYSSIANYFWDYRVGLIQGCKPITGAFSDDYGHEGGLMPLREEDLDTIWGAVNDGAWVLKSSGKYYLPEPIYASNLSFFIGDSDGVNPALDVTICMHGNRTSELRVLNGSILHLCDCKETGGTQSVSVLDRSKLIVDSGVFSVSCHGNSEVIINGGICRDLMGFDESTITINNGKITSTFLYAVGNGSNTLVVKSGEVSGIQNNSGTVTISGGTITATSDRTCGISNLNGKVSINGGTIYGGIHNSNDAQLFISNGTIYGGIANSSVQPVTICINNGSDIQISGTQAFDVAPTVLADIGYSGYITYYSSESDAGTLITIEQAASIDYTQPYIRLVAGGSASSGNCEHIYTAVVTAPTCTERGYTTHTCDLCGEAYTDSHTPPLGHSYGAWNTIQSATPTATGLQERVCSRCGDRETRIIPATGESGGSAEGSGSHSSDRDSDPGPSYPVNEPKTENGSLSISPQNAVSGAIVTVTVKPDTGYELDTLTVTNKGGRQVRVTSKGNGQYTFRMPGSEAEIRATFKPIMSFVPAAAGTFSDVPTDHWAGTEISWALENGVMNGVGDGKFNPNGTVTRQQLWMTLARMAGEAPVDMAAAKIWAVNNSISDGSVPGNTITRQQMAVILYRFAKLMGHSVAGNGDLSPYSDSGEISSYAGEAMAWAVGSGILNGTADGALNPNGTATRVQMAVILYRFYGRVIHV